MKPLSFPPGVEVREQEPLSKHTTMGVGGPARFWINLPDLETARVVLRTLQEAELPFYPLGGGSDVIVLDEGFDGAILHPGGARALAVQDRRVIVGAGWVLTRFLQKIGEMGLGGLEGLYGIPGTVGGAVAKNAGAFGQEIAEAVEWVETITPEGEILRVSRDEAGFTYRDSRVRTLGVIWRVALRVNPGDPGAILSKMRKIYARRIATQPYGIHSSGCIFRNPPGDAAGRILDHLGLKGLRRGGVEVSRVHANFLVHRGGGKAGDVVELVRTLHHRVREATGIPLWPEVVFLGRTGEVPYEVILHTGRP